MKRFLLLSALLLALFMPGIFAQGEVSPQPIDREATGPTRQLYRYLRDFAPRLFK